MIYMLYESKTMNMKINVFTAQKNQRAHKYAQQY